MGGSVVLTDEEVLVLAADEGVNNIAEAVDGSGAVQDTDGHIVA